MNFIAIMTIGGRGTREVDFFDTKEAGMAHCTEQNAWLKQSGQNEAHWIIRELKDVF